VLDTEIENRIAKIVERLAMLEHLSDPGWRAKRHRRVRETVDLSKGDLIAARAAARRAYSDARKTGSSTSEAQRPAVNARNATLRKTSGVKDAA
jgi:hypothetical protein